MSKKTKTLLTAVLVLTIAVGATLAYIVSSTNTAVNKFTLQSGEDLEGEIIEEWEETDGQDLTPGAEVDKVVSMRNISNPDMDATKARIYGGLQIWFDKVDAAGVAKPMTDEEFKKVYPIMTLVDLNPLNEWEPNATPAKNGTIYFYKDLIERQPAPGDDTNDTPPLFTAVKISEDLDTTLADEILAFAPGGINIRIEGAIAQGTNITAAEAREEIIAHLEALHTP